MTEADVYRERLEKIAALAGRPVRLDGPERKLTAALEELEALRLENEALKSRIHRDAVAEAKEGDLRHQGHPLAAELAAFEAARPHLIHQLKAEGQYAVFKGTNCLGVGSYDEALQLGYDRCGLSGFLVKRIERIDTVYCL